MSRIPASRWVPLALALGLLSLLYLSTLETSINGSDSPYAKDTGEIQIVLNVGGVMHYTGYPLYTLLGWLFTLATRRAVGMGSAPSLFSTVATLVTGAILYVLMLRLGADERISGAAILLWGVLESVWVHATIAEVYAMSMAFWAGIVLVTLTTRRPWRTRDYALLAALLGFGIAHHRLLALTAPLILIVWAPQMRDPKSRRLFLRSLPISSALFAAGFLPYIYLPIRAMQTAPFLYDRTDTWEGFWRVFTSSEVSYLIVPAPAGEVPGNLLRALSALSDQITPIGVLISAATLVWLLLRGDEEIGPITCREFGMAMGTLMATYLGFLTVFPEAVLPEATLMPLNAVWVVTMAAALPAKRWEISGRYGVTSIVLPIITILFAVANLPSVTEITRDPASEELIALLDEVGPLPPDLRSVVVVEPWGRPYFAVWWGLHVEGRLRGFAVVDHRADLGNLLNGGLRICTTDHMFYTFPPEWFEERLGRLHLRACGPPGLVELAIDPWRNDAMEPMRTLDNGVQIVGIETSLDEHSTTLDVLIIWRATVPVEADYSVMVHIGRTGPIADPADMLAQADSYAPVSGRYPTSRWEPGELVPDAYRATLPAEAADGPLFLTVGMYRALPDGSTGNAGYVSLSLR